MITLGLIGYPLEHSLSPVMHQAALQASHLTGEYLLFPVPPASNGNAGFEPLLEDLRSGKLRGLNVTIPYKQAVISHLDRLTPVARQIGAVNTIFMDQGHLVGDNTDAPGFYQDLPIEMGLNFVEQVYDPPRTAVVLGAGGAARAVVFVLHRRGWHIQVVARRLEQSQTLVEEYEKPVMPKGFRQGEYPIPSVESGTAPVSAVAWESVAGTLGERRIDLIVNTTPVGMRPQVEQSPWPATIRWPERVFVYDLVYNPAVTQMVLSARAAGLRAVNGAGMLVEQAALSFELWTGRKARREAMRQVLNHRLEELNGK